MSILIALTPQALSSGLEVVQILGLGAVLLAALLITARC